MEKHIPDSATLTPEELLGPPKIDLYGLLLISIISLVIGFSIGIIVFLLSFFFLGSFSLQSGASPILLGIITFFATIIGNYLYLWGLINIFPHIYTRSRTLAMHISVFSIVLYICMSIIYIIIINIGLGTGVILSVYIAHIIFNIFGLLLLTGILSFYRYSLLIFYSNIISLLVSSIIPVFVYINLDPSVNTLFIFILFSTIAFGIGTVVTFSLLYLYYKLYITSGYDPIGVVFSQIAHDEIELEKQAEKALFHSI